MAKLMTVLEQHLDRMPPTVVSQATTWWETILAHVKQQGIGLGVHLPVNVCFLFQLAIKYVKEVNYICRCIPLFNSCGL